MIVDITQKLSEKSWGREGVLSHSEERKVGPGDAQSGQEVEKSVSIPDRMKSLGWVGVSSIYAPALF